MIAIDKNFISSLRFGVTTLVFVALCGVGSTAQAKIKCWKNHEGVRECGDSVPPEFAQQGHEEKSAGGVTVDSKARAKSLEELAAERAAERARADAELQQREQAARDRVLLDTFSSDDDMVLARDGQITHIKSQIRLTKSHTEKLNSSLAVLIEEAADHERRGNQPPEKLLGDITSLRQQIHDNQEFVKAKRSERRKLIKKFDADIARFRELKSAEN